MEYIGRFGRNSNAVFGLAFIPKLTTYLMYLKLKIKKPNTLLNVFGFFFVMLITYDTFLRFLGLTKVKFKKCSSESSRMSSQGSGNSGDIVPVKVER